MGVYTIVFSFEFICEKATKKRRKTQLYLSIQSFTDESSSGKDNIRSTNILNKVIYSEFVQVIIFVDIHIIFL
jgi:type II restriction/modification system DNA methylase subunit YeeA